MGKGFLLMLSLVPALFATLLGFALANMIRPLLRAPHAAKALEVMLPALPGAYLGYGLLLFL